jgi:hypothetical protein
METGSFFKCCPKMLWVYSGKNYASEGKSTTGAVQFNRNNLRWNFRPCYRVLPSNEWILDLSV